MCDCKYEYLFLFNLIQFLTLLTMLEGTWISKVQQTSTTNKNVQENRNRKYTVPTDLNKTFFCLRNLDRKDKHCAFRKDILSENTSIENETLRSENI